VAGGWRKLHSEEIHNLYSSPGTIGMIKPRRMRWTGHVAQMGEKSNVGGKARRKKPLGRRRRRWLDNIKMVLREIRWDGMDWIDLAQDRDQWRALVNTVMSSCKFGFSSRRAQLHK
jgi:hypothetical protein